jgi:16S rRNA (cytosine967-C5)-methyltransferase
MISPARRAAFEILRRVDQEQAYASVLLAAMDPRMREDDRALCHELVLGVLRNQLWLDRVVDYFADRDSARIDLPVRLALRLALYQLRFLSRIPASAAVNESVNLVRAAGLKSAASFANAVLREAARNPDYDPTLDATDEVEKLSIETSHPAWMIERWIRALGFQDAAMLARANNKSPSLAFRFTSRSVARREALLKELESSGAKLAQSKILANAWRVSRVNDVVRRFLNDGLIYFQDEASQLVAHIVGATSGDRILDVCAAPGSKATQIAALAPNATVLGGDFYLHRLSTMRNLAERQASRLQLMAYDASVSLPFTEGSFDRVVLDAPCSGTGTLRHNPEIRWRLRASDIEELAIKQRKILANAAAMVRPGGRLVYSTCSFEPEENEEVISDFLDGQSDFEMAPASGLAGLCTRTGAIRTWPHQDDIDGFFVVTIDRRN